MVKRTTSYLVCMSCRRVYPKSELERERKEKRRETYVCPYCGSMKFSQNFDNIVLIMNPEKSLVAKKLKLIHSGVFAFSIE
ncbi:MAG: hypothetical protein ACTSX9_00770 [Candidatus Njordarchaeales archaeon]